MTSQLKNLDKQNSLQKMNITLRLRENVNINTILGQSILAALDSNTPINEVLSFIYEQAIDNPDLMKTIIGEELTNQILNIKN